MTKGVTANQNMQMVLGVSIASNTTLSVDKKLLVD